MDMHCCQMMSERVNYHCNQHDSPFDCPDHLILYTKAGRYGLIVHDGGTSSIKIQFCPWCGKKLGESSREN